MLLHTFPAATISFFLLATTVRFGKETTRGEHFSQKLNSKEHRLFNQAVIMKTIHDAKAKKEFLKMPVEKEREPSEGRIRSVTAWCLDTMLHPPPGVFRTCEERSDGKSSTADAVP